MQEGSQTAEKSTGQAPVVCGGCVAGWARIAEWEHNTSIQQNRMKNGAKAAKPEKEARIEWIPGPGALLPTKQAVPARGGGWIEASEDGTAPSIPSTVQSVARTPGARRWMAG
jgi:hypothetical protein